MIENIELQPINNDYSDKSNNNSDEYYEISQEVLGDNMVLSKSLGITIKDHDFFLQFDTEKVNKSSSRKQKSKKKSKSKKLMDVINSELFAKPILLKNNITYLNHTKERDIFIAQQFCLSKIFDHKRLRNDNVENGLIRRDILSISPIFPRVLENSLRKDTIAFAQYVEPSLFNDIITEYMESETRQNPRFLDVILNNLEFKHHHEFSLEKLLCIKLIDIYKEYEVVKKTLKDLHKNVEVNRMTRNRLKEELAEINTNIKEDIKFDATVLKYTQLMLDFKEKYYSTLQREKEVIHELLTLWADVEMIREKTGYVKTDYNLEVTEILTEDSESQKKWSETFEIEYSDLIVKIEYDYVKKYLEYKQRKQERSSNNRNVNKKITKPKLNIDYDELKIIVEEIVNDILIKDKIEVVLKRDRSILSNTDYKRKFATFSNYLYFKVFVDDLFVCESEQYLNEDGHFHIDFIESLSIEILPNNRYLKLILFENNEDVASLTINLFDIRKNTNESNFVKFKLVYSKVVEPSNKKIGSGHDIKEIGIRNKTRLKSSNLFKDKLWTACEVYIKFGWSDKLNDNQRESTESCINTGRKIRRLLQNKDKPNIEVLTEIINDLFENNIEQNENIMKAVKDICKGTIKKNDIFDIDENSPDYIRFKLLHLRNNGGFAAVEDKTVPLFTSQITTEQLACLQKSEEKDYRDIKRDLDMDAIDSQRYIGMKFVEKLNKNLMIHVNEFLLRRTYKDVVKDFGHLSLRNIFFNQTDLSLVGSSNIIKQKLLKEELLNEQEIHVNVLRAFNLIDRSATILEDEGNDDENIAGFKVRPLRPFVRLCYHGVSAQTATAIGCHPTWNNTVKLMTKFEPLSSISINIYDEYKDNITETNSDDQSSQSTLHYRKTNKWLGAIHVPLHTVLSFGSIRGTFKINTPAYLFGYDNMSTKDNQSFIPEVLQFMKKETSLLVLQISTSLSHLGGDQIYNQPVLSQAQDDFVIQQLNKFVTDYINDFPARNISLTFIDSAGRHKCVAEFLQSIPIPDFELPLDPKKAESALSKSSGHSRSSSSKSSGFEALKNEKDEHTRKIDAVVRYVSLIPTYDVTESHVITLMGVELLKVLYGSPLDHTLLLASYFINLGIKCYIIIGFGLPRGHSSYVLVKYLKNRVLTIKDHLKSSGFFKKIDGSTWYIYDALSGERFELREIGCPLKTVSYVFDSENIWVNAQVSQACENVSFEFSNSSDWQTVFDKPFFGALPLLTECLYSKPGDVENIRVNLEAKIKSKVQKWRPHIKTIWNRYCSSLLKEMLPHYEYWSFNPMEPRPSLGNRMKQLMATYKIFGFPLNIPYINTKLIVSSVKSTSIHANDDPNVEFGLAVEVYAYPNNVLSVWVFLVGITRI